MKRLKRGSMLQLGLLAAVPFIMVLGNSMLIPVLPRIRTALNLTNVQVGLIITAFSLTAGLTIPLTGFLSDRIGRKTVMVPALLIYGLGGIMAGVFSVMAKRYLLIMVARVVQGFGAGGTYQLAMALAADVFPAHGRSRVLGVLEAGNGLGKVVSPLAGAAVMLITWYAPFFVYGFLAIPIAILVWVFVKESPVKEKPRELNQYFKTLRHLWADRGISVLGCFVAGFVVLFMLFGLLADFSDVLEERFAIKGFAKGLIIAIPVLSMAATAYLTGVVTQKKSPSFLKGAVWMGLALEAVCITGLSFLRGLWGTVAVFSLAGIGSGLVLPSLNTLITSSAHKEERGLITALYGSMRFFGAAFGPPAFGLVLALGRRWMFWGAAAVTALVAFAVYSLVSAEHMVPKRAANESVGKQRVDDEAREPAIDNVW